MDWGGDAVRSRSCKGSAAPARPSAAISRQRTQQAILNPDDQRSGAVSSFQCLGIAFHANTCLGGALQHQQEQPWQPMCSPESGGSTAAAAAVQHNAGVCVVTALRCVACCWQRQEPSAGTVVQPSAASYSGPCGCTGCYGWSSCEAWPWQQGRADCCNRVRRQQRQAIESQQPQPLAQRLAHQRLLQHQLATTNAPASCVTIHRAYGDDLGLI
jgi:hypothetical protein